MRKKRSREEGWAERYEKRQWVRKGRGEGSKLVHLAKGPSRGKMASVVEYNTAFKLNLKCHPAAVIRDAAHCALENGQVSDLLGWSSK